MGQVFYLSPLAFSRVEGLMKTYEGIKQLFESGKLAPELIEAYQATHYRVDDPAGSFVLRIGVYSPDLVSCHARYDVEHSVYITAWNPFSRQCSSAENAEAETKLNQTVEAMGLVWIPGFGTNPDGEWPGEASLLVLGLDGDGGQRLAHQFSQNAVVGIGLDAIPKLLVCVE